MGKRVWGRAAAGVALAVLGCGAAAAELDKALLAKAEQARPEALGLLERLVNIDSGSFNGAGLDRVGAIAREELAKLGFKVETSPAAPGHGSNVVATLAGTGRGRVLMVAHMDTVFPDGAAAVRPFRIEGNRAYGPGIMDDKGGIVIALAALNVLQQSGFTGYAKLTLLLNTNEETGSHGTRVLMDKLSREHDVALHLEPGRPADGLVVMRKGSGEIEVDIKGKAAHAGVAPDAGRNAGMEAAHQMLQLSRLADSGKQTTVNFTVIKAGDRVNVIPDQGLLQADVRVAVPEEFERIERDLARISANRLVPDARVSARLKRGFPPMPRSPVTDAVAARATAVYAELGRKLTLESSGGAADSALTFQAGVPTIDGLGIVGGAIHTPEEYAEVDSIAPRVYLLARLIQEYGK